MYIIEIYIYIIQINMLVQKSIKNIYLGEYTEPTPSTIVLFDDDFTTMSNSQLIAQWFLSVGDSYGLTTSSNWLHRVTFETDTASWIELPVSYNLQWKTLYWECEWYSWTFKRWWNIWRIILIKEKNMMSLRHVRDGELD